MSDGEIQLIMPDWGQIIPEAARKAAQFYVQPANLSGLAGSVMLPLVVFRHKPPLLPYLIMAAMGWAAGRMAYQASRDLHDLAVQARTEADA